MQRKVKQVEKLVKLLKDPDARFVSIVDHGANQTPFSTLKRHNGGKPMAVRKRLKASKKTEAAKKGATKTAGVRKLVFASDQFEDEAAVKSWLEDNQWEDYTISKTKKGFIAETEGVTDEDFEDLRDVSVVKGVTGVVGTPKTASDEDAADEDAEDDADAEGDGAESTKKFDWWGAYLSGNDDVPGVLEDAMKDGVPPGFDEMVFATTVAMANAMKANDSDLKTKLVKAGEDLGNIAYSIHEAFAQLTASAEDDTQKAVIAKQHADWLASLDKVAEAKALFGVEDLDLGEEAEEAADDADDAEEGVQTSAPEDDGGEVAKTLAAMQKTLEALTTAVADAGTKAEDAAKAASEATQKADAVAKRAPTKKAAANDANDEGDEGEDNADDDFDRTLTLRSLGARC